MNNNRTITPIFLFSLPRSGSTLVQRILVTHPDITTASEPWILLPFLSTLRKNGVYTDYRHMIAYKAMQDFCTELPRGQLDYLDALRDFTLELYTKAALSQGKYFLDKTPRYHLIVEEIMQLFPEAKFIFLWRNPLAVVASMLGLFDRERWELYRFQVDLFSGLQSLVRAFEKHQSQVCSIRYEDVIANPVSALTQIFAYLDLSFDPERISGFDQVHLSGRLGDPTGVNEYHAIATAPLQKWKRVLANPVRKLWGRRYLTWIGADRLRLMGYDLENLLAELRAIPFSPRNMFGDIPRMLLGTGYCLAEPYIIKYKWQHLTERGKIYAHA